MNSLALTIERVDFHWDKPKGLLIASVQTDKGTLDVGVPLRAVHAALMGALARYGLMAENMLIGDIDIDGDLSVDGWWSSVKHSVSRAVRKVSKPLRKHVFKRIARGIRKARKSIAKRVVRLAKKAITLNPIYAMTAAAIKGKNWKDVLAASAGPLSGATRQLMAGKIQKGLTGYAKAFQQASRYVPGVGTGVAAGLAAGIAASEGKNWKDIVASGAAGALPGGEFVRGAASGALPALLRGNVKGALTGAARSSLSSLTSRVSAHIPGVTSFSGLPLSPSTVAVYSKALDVKRLHDMAKRAASHAKRTRRVTPAQKRVIQRRDKMAKTLGRLARSNDPTIKALFAILQRL